MSGDCIQFFFRPFLLLQKWRKTGGFLKSILSSTCSQGPSFSLSQSLSSPACSPFSQWRKPAVLKSSPKVFQLTCNLTLWLFYGTQFEINLLLLKEKFSKSNLHSKCKTRLSCTLWLKLAAHILKADNKVLYDTRIGSISHWLWVNYQPMSTFINLAKTWNESYGEKKPPGFYFS